MRQIDSEIMVRQMGVLDYKDGLKAQQAFTRARHFDDRDELWIVEHPAVFTLGQAGKMEHVLNPGEIPVVRSDRGGQVTYHGPGQVVIYPLLNVKRCKMTVRGLVSSLERAVIHCLKEFGLEGETRSGAPGVYVDERKIAALGLRISRGFSYHGLSVNVAMDLAPFERINPCGYTDLKVTDLVREGVVVTPKQVSERLITKLKQEISLARTGETPIDPSLMGAS